MAVNQDLHNQYLMVTLHQAQERYKYLTVLSALTL